MISRLFGFIISLWRIIKGSAALRFSIFLVATGASFMIPMLWEALLEVIVGIINIIFQVNLEVPSLKENYTPGTREVIIGCIIILIGILIFVYFYNRKLKNSSILNLHKYEKLMDKWELVNNLRDELDRVVISDVIYAINLLNETSTLLPKMDEDTLKEFLDVRRGDFEKLYLKLLNNNYPINDSTSSKLLSNKTTIFYKKHIYNGKKA